MAWHGSTGRSKVHLSRPSPALLSTDISMASIDNGPQMHLAPSSSTGSDPSSTETRVMSEEPGRYGHTSAPLTSSPGEVATPPIQSAMRKKTGERQGTGHVSVLEPSSAGEHRDSNDAGHENAHGFSEKLHGLRHRSNKKTQSGHTEVGSQAGRPTPQRSLSGGPRGFLQRIATVSNSRQRPFCVCLKIIYT